MGLDYIIAVSPDIEDIFEILISDFSLLENNMDYLELSNDLGYDMNDRKQKRHLQNIWNNMENMKEDFIEVFGYNIYNELLEI